MDGHPAFLLVGVAAGVASGLFGLGGGLVIVPALVTVGIPMPIAVGTSLLAVLGNGLVGAAQHARHGNVLLSRGLWMALGAVPAAAGGSALAGLLPELLLTALFLAMVVAGGVLLARRRAGASGPTAAVSRVSFWAAPATGAVGGLMAGLFGVGGGAFVVPLQVLLLHSRMHAAVGTSLVVVSASSAIALATHAWQGHVSWSIGLLATVGGFLGAPLGVRIAQRLSDRRLRLGFVAFTVVLAGTMIVDLIRELGA